jgi:hypothetical protein
MYAKRALYFFFNFLYTRLLKELELCMSICCINSYFDGLEKIQNFESNTTLENIEAIVKIASYCTIIIPLLVYTADSLYSFLCVDTTPMSYPSPLSRKVQQQANEILRREEPQGPVALQVSPRSRFSESLITCFLAEARFFAYADATQVAEANRLFNEITTILLSSSFQENPSEFISRISNPQNRAIEFITFHVLPIFYYQHPDTISSPYLSITHINAHSLPFFLRKASTYAYVETHSNQEQYTTLFNP